MNEEKIADRKYEMQQQMEKGFWARGGYVAGSFAVVAQILAEQESRIEALELALSAATKSKNEAA